MANSVTYNTIDTAIRRYISPDLSQAEVFSKAGVFLEKLMEKKEVHAGSGIDLVWEYLKNPNFGTFGSHSQFKARAHSPLTKGPIEWTNYYCNVLVSDHDLRIQGNSIEKIIDLAKVQIKNGMTTMKTNIAADVFSDGSVISDDSVAPGDEPRGRVSGLGLVLAENTAYAGITPSTTNNLWHQPFTVSMASATNSLGETTPWNTSNATYADIQTATEAEYLPRVVRYCMGRVKNGLDQVDLIVCDPDTYTVWHNIFLTKQQIMSETEVGKLGFTGLKWMNAVIVEDQNCPSGTMYGLNMAKWELHFLSGAELTWTGLEKIGGEVEGKSGKFLASMAIGCRARNRNFKISSIPVTA